MTVAERPTPGRLGGYLFVVPERGTGVNIVASFSRDAERSTRSAPLRVAAKPGVTVHHLVGGRS
jgi:hypothetical protein